eukprot:COSAG06_NODE_16113_length_1021_cov_2.066161_2_plen_70_part_01
MLPVAIYSFVPPGCRRGRLAAALPWLRPSGRLAPASGLSLGRLALVALTCLLVVTSLSIYSSYVILVRTG